MTTYTVTGHPLNYANLAFSADDTQLLQAALSQAGVGTTIDLTLSPTDETTIINQDIIETQD